MRRQELTKAAGTVLKALGASSLKATLGQHLKHMRQADEAKPPSPEYLISSMRTYWSFTNLYTPNEKQVAESLKLSPLEDPKFWADLLVGGADAPQKAYAVLETVSAAENHLPTVLSLVNDTSSEPRSENSLSLILAEDAQGLSRPARVVGALESIDIFYSVYAELLNKNPSELGLSACDSGKDKVFLFVGDAEILASIKKCLLELWDRVIFFRDRQDESYLEFLAESLPVMGKITDLQGQGEFSEVQVEALKTQLVEGVMKFISTGAMIPEIVTVASFQPQELLMPDAEMFADPPLLTDEF